MSTDGPEELSSWKEIAERLQVTVRTAQEWEKQRGLPVRRMPGGGRSRVYLRVDDLEQWLDQGDDASGELAGTGRWRPWLWSAVAAGIVLLAAAYLLVPQVPRAAPHPAPVPTDWRITRNALVVLDEQGEELWRARFDEELEPGAYDMPVASVPLFVDLDGDGRKETLLRLDRADMTLPDPLVCLDADGHELWRYQVDASMRTATDERFENIYHVATYEPVRLADGSMGIVVASVHYLYYPTQVALISATDGHLIAEYWHAGHIGTLKDRLVVADYDGDGRAEVFVGGVSNARNQATLVVLDPETMTGASVEEDPAYQFVGLDPPNEIARVLFPRTAVSRLYDFNIIDSVWLTPESINVRVREALNDPMGPSLMYHLRPDFTLDRKVSATSLESAYERLLHEGVLTTPLQEELASLPPLQYIGTARPLTGGQ